MTGVPAVVSHLTAVCCLVLLLCYCAVHEGGDMYAFLRVGSGLRRVFCCI